MVTLTRKFDRSHIPLYSLILAVFSQGLVLFLLGSWLNQTAPEEEKSLLVNFLKPPSETASHPQDKPLQASPKLDQILKNLVKEVFLPPKPKISMPQEKIQKQHETKAPAKKVASPPAKKSRAKLAEKPISSRKPVPPEKIKGPPTSSRIKTKISEPHLSTFQQTSPINPDKTQIEPIGSANQARNSQIETQEPVAAEIDEEVKLQYLQKIRKILQSKLRYPSAARRRNISGTIQLSFQIDRAGNAFNLEIHNPANSILKNAAIKLLNKTRLPAPPDKWRENAVIEIPLKFSLR